MKSTYYYLSFKLTVVSDIAIPIKVTALASTGVATRLGCAPETEDTITLLVQVLFPFKKDAFTDVKWKNLQNSNLGTAIYTGKPF